MTTEEAFIKALERKRITKQYSKGAVRKWKYRLKRSELTIDFMVKFLLLHGFIIKSEYNWGVPRENKGKNVFVEHDPEAIASHSANHYVDTTGDIERPSLTITAAGREASPDQIVGTPEWWEKNGRDVQAIEGVNECTNYSGRRNLSKEELEERMALPAPYVQRCLSCRHTREECKCPEFNDVEPLVL